MGERERKACHKKKKNHASFASGSPYCYFWLFPALWGLTEKWLPNLGKTSVKYDRKTD